MSDDKLLRISFLQSVFYSFWLYLKKILPEKESDLPLFASVLFLTCRFINILFILVLVSWLVDVDFINTFFERFGVDVAFLILIVTAFLGIYTNDVFFLKRFNAIHSKYQYATNSEVKRYKNNFFAYLAITTISGVLIIILI